MKTEVLAGVMTAALVLSQPDVPGPRFGHSLVYDGQRVLLVDGYTWVRALATTEPPATTELWSWDGAAWTRLAGRGPSSRTMGRAVYDSARKTLVSYGGRVGRAETPSSETWEWSDGAWRKRSDASTGPDVHVEIAYDAARARPIQFGGAISEGQGRFRWPTDTWAWTGSEWTRIATAGPPGRAASSMVFDRARNEIVLFGGQGAAPGAGQPQPRFGDTWLWNGSSWREVTAAGPSARAFHAMSFDERRGVVLLYGGELGSDVLSDMWAWNGRSWTQLQPAGPSPGRRRLHAMVYDAGRDRTVLYGGVGPGSTGNTIAYGDTWEWDGTSWTRIR